MADLTEDKIRVFEATADSDFNDLGVDAAAVIFKGSGCSQALGVVHQLVAAEPFVGFAEAKADNSGGADNDINVHLRRRGFIHGVIASVTAADIGAKVSMSDGDVFTLTTLANSTLGFVHALDPEVADGVVIRFDADFFQDAS